MGNWPFLVFLFFLAGVLSIIPARDGQWTIVLALFGAIGVAPAIIGITLRIAEPFGKRHVDALHENGIVWRRGMARGFLAWSELSAIRRIDRKFEGMKFDCWEIEDRFAGSTPIVLEDAVGSHEGGDVIASKIASRLEAQVGLA